MVVLKDDPIEKLLKSYPVSFGFDQVSTHVESIIKELTTRKDSEGVSIIGLRGMGKTALAKHILNHDDVKGHFPLILEASFPDKTFQPELPTLKILWVDENSVSQKNDQITLQFLKDTNHKWLLWMDGLPKMSIHDWLNFKKDMNGNFLFTTVNPNVATTTKTYPYWMGTLSDICCQHLIQGLRCHKNHAQELTNNCYGLLSIAEFLTNYINNDGNLHEQMCNTKLWGMTEFRKELLPHLASNFQTLKGVTLKYFYYFSLFPQQHQLDEEELIWLRVCTVGLLEATNNSNISSSLEERRKYFNNLLAKSILQRGNEDLKYELHKFAHGFAQFSAPKIYLPLSIESQVNALNNRNLYHLSVTQTVQTKLQGDIKLRKCLRTFISTYDGDGNNEHDGKLKEIQPDLFSMMKHLRVVVLKNTDIKELPYIAHLKRLRFLDISETLVGSLPKEVCALPYLQILKFKKGTRQAVQLPDNFNKMTALVYVDWDFNCISNLQALPSNIGSLINLETLPLFIVNEKEGHRITELEKMNCLRNSLCITNLEAAQNEDEAKQACIGDKSGLRSLQLIWTLPKKETAKEVLSGLKPHTRLKELHIVNYHSDAYPLWFGERSLELEKIHLDICSSFNFLESFGQLSALKVFHLQGMHELKSMDSLFGRIPESTSQYILHKLEVTSTK